MIRRNFLKLIGCLPIAGLTLETKAEVKATTEHGMPCVNPMLKNPMADIIMAINYQESEGYEVKDIMVSADIYKRLIDKAEESICCIAPNPEIVEIGGVRLGEILHGFKKKAILIISRVENVCGNILPVKYVVILDFA